MRAQDRAAEYDRIDDGHAAPVIIAGLRPLRADRRPPAVCQAVLGHRAGARRRAGRGGPPLRLAGLLRRRRRGSTCCAAPARRPRAPSCWPSTTSSRAWRWRSSCASTSPSHHRGARAQRLALLPAAQSRHRGRQTRDARFRADERAQCARALGLERHQARTLALRFRRHNLELVEQMRPHTGDEAQLIAIAKQGPPAARGAVRPRARAANQHRGLS